MSAAGRALSKALDSPGDWRCGEYEIFHIPSNTAFWRRNGSFFFDGSGIEGTPSCLGLIERHWLYFKARKVRGQWRRQRNEAECVAKRDVAAAILRSLESPP